MAKAGETKDRCTQYALDVVSGKITAGEYVRLACQRHLDDIEKSKAAPYKYYFDVEKSEEIINFAEELTIAEGEENEHVTAYPFQCFILGSLNGWRTKELTFDYPASGALVDLLKEEYYIRTKTDEFVLKAVEKGEQFNKYTAVLNVEELEGTAFPYGFESDEQTIKACLEFAFEGTGWHVGTCTVTKKRTIDEQEKRTRFDYNGEHFYRDGKYVGKIGTNTMIGNDSQRGLVFDIEYDTAYMSWANKESANGSSCMMKWAYCTQQCNNYEANMLHAGADINMHYYKLRNVSFEDGAINGTLTFKQPLAVSSDGTLSKWSTATLTFKNGILISGAWSNG